MRPYSIYIDPGHGGKDCGAVSLDGKYREKDIVLDIGRLFRRCVLDGDYLFTPYITRLSDRYITLEARCKMANERRVDAFISLHLNSAVSPVAEGLEVWHYPGCHKSKLLALELHLALKSAMPGIKERGVKEGNFYVLKHTNMPAVLVELEFLSNPQEYATDIQAQRRIAKGMAETVEMFLEGGYHDEG